LELGSVVGISLGSVDGVPLGDALGDAVGLAEGFVEGFSVGAMTGVAVGGGSKTRTGAIVDAPAGIVLGPTLGKSLVTTSNKGSSSRLRECYGSIQTSNETW
jgi:hypothetical protein